MTEKETKKMRDEELDRFWDIDALIPRRRMPAPAADTSTTEIVLDTPVSKPENAPRTEQIPASEEVTRHFIPPHTAEEFAAPPKPELEYVPENALLRSVRVYRVKVSYRYYEGFVNDAVRLLTVRGGQCPRTPFFSYVPQYSQMTRPQLEWYLWWRTCVREGKFLDTDYSYILLYAYELLNLSGKMPPKTIQDELCKIWIHYRDIFYQLDSYLPNWICDFSLLHRLPSPASCTGKLLPAVMSCSVLKEFYASVDGEEGYLRALLAFCSNYQYGKSKFYTKENAPLFDRAVSEALRCVMMHLSRDGKLFSMANMDDSKMVREAYTGALCSWRIKRRIEVEYCSFSRSHELRYFITDVVKYAENKVRAALSIRSRLTVYALSAELRALIDRTLDPVLPVRKTVAEKREEECTAYEKLYDLPQKALSLSDAAAIERESWDTTERLIEAFEEETTPEEFVKQQEILQPPVPQIAACEPAGKAEEEFSSFSMAVSPYLGLLIALYREDTDTQWQEAKRLGMPLEVAVDEINAIALDHLEDILIEACDHGFCVIEDYRDLPALAEAISLYEEDDHE